jgi:hypothetical protein
MKTSPTEKKEQHQRIKEIRLHQNPNTLASRGFRVSSLAAISEGSPLSSPNDKRPKSLGTILEDGEQEDYFNTRRLNDTDKRTSVIYPADEGMI